MKKLVIISIITLFLINCASRFASNGEKIYLQSRNGLGVVINPPLTDSNISHFYDLPQQDSKSPNVSVVPPKP